MLLEADDQVDPFPSFPLVDAFDGFQMHLLSFMSGFGAHRSGDVSSRIEQGKTASFDIVDLGEALAIGAYE